MPKKEVVVKSNRLIEAIQTLNLIEARLLQLAIIDARETGLGLSSESPLELNAKRYAEAFNVSDDAAYLALIDAEDSLFKRQFTITNEDGSSTKSRWIQDVTYKRGQGRILITLTRVVINEVIRIDGLEKYFTHYRLEQTARLSSVYAVRLYELVIKWQSVGKTPCFKIDEFRKQMGLGVDEYSTMGNFKARVLDIAVEQINKCTDIKLKYDQEKAGRKIVGFKFSFKSKKPIEPISPSVSESNSDDKFFKMTAAQLDTFSGKLSLLPEVQEMAQVGEDMKAFTSRIRLMLSDPIKQERLHSYLTEIGFNR